MVPVGVVAQVPSLVVVGPGFPGKTLKDLLAAAKARPNDIQFASSGIGTTSHVGAALMESMTGVEMLHVPYKGGGPLMTDAVAGHVPLAMGTVFLSKPHIDNKRIRPLAVTSLKRVPEFPDVPTIAEAGYPGFEAPAWWAVLAPAKTPPDIVKRMNEELNKVLKNPEVAKKLDAQGIDVVGGSTAQAAAFIDKQMSIWAKVVKDNGIKAD